MPSPVGPQRAEHRIANLRLEYEQLNEQWRHNETTGWAIAAILMPSAIGAIALMAQAPDLAMRLIFGASAIGLSLGANLILGRNADATAARSERASEIEAVLGMDHHRRVNLKLHGSGCRIQHHHVWWGLFVVVLASVACVSFRPYPAPTECRCCADATLARDAPAPIAR